MKQIAFTCLMLFATLALGVQRERLEQYQTRRQQLAVELDGAIVLSAAAAEDLVQYQQEDNFYYLTGFREPASILLLDATGDAMEEFLFIPTRDLDEERWTGVKLGPGIEAAEQTGFGAVEELAAFGDRLKAILEDTNTVYTLTDQEADLSRLREIAPRANFEDIRPAIAAMRQVKAPTEISLLEKAIELTLNAHEAAASIIRPEVMEYEVEAVIEYEFRQGGAERPAFPSIVGSGPFASILHYDRNDRRMLDGDLVVVDIGAEYGGYTADITRTYPVNGRFTERQREIYQIVLDAQKAALERVKPGARTGGADGIHAAARDYIESKGYGDYFIHGTSHHIGLHVHDVGDTRRELEPNMVLTVEPGIYIPDENIGVRIEDDVVVTETGYRMLSDFPREIDEIEALMAIGSDE
jgi:Xaa-Pro aminopeptidase